MVETRGSRRRSRSDLSAKSQDSSITVVHETETVQEPQNTENHQETRVTERTLDSSLENNDDDNNDSSDNEDNSLSETDGKVLPKKKKEKVPTSKNQLSKLIPGYVAPHRLQASSKNYTSGLEALRKQAMQKELSRTIPSSIPTATTRTSFKLAHAHKNKVVSNDAGPGWFGMKATPMTKELEKDIQLIRHRNYLDPKKFYKSSDPFGKYIQVGTVVEGPTEYYSSRLTKRERRGNLVDEIVASGGADYVANKYKDMQQKATAQQLSRRRRHKKQRR